MLLTFRRTGGFPLLLGRLYQQLLTNDDPGPLELVPLLQLFRSRVELSRDAEESVTALDCVIDRHLDERGYAGAQVTLCGGIPALFCVDRVDVIDERIERRNLAAECGKLTRSHAGVRNAD